MLLLTALVNVYSFSLSN